MKILCVADQIDPLVYSPSIKTRFRDVDLVLSAGDLPLDYLDFVVSSLNCPLLFVFGNHNLEEYETCRKNSRNSPLFFREKNTPVMVHAGSVVRTEGGLIIAGLGGSMRYNRGNNQYTETQMMLEICKLIPRLLWFRIVRRRRPDILLTHAAPRGIHDREDPCHRGFKCFRWFIKTWKPRYLVHGHIHLYDLSGVRSTRCADTTVINAYGHYLIHDDEQ
ncbi:MAG: metallophosphoesterase [Treponema sp.]|nr:metallophosphoesterase [Treponema sp.]